MIKPLEYYYDNGFHVIFDKYTIDTSGVVRNKKSGKKISTRKKGGYNACGVYNKSGKQCMLFISRAIVSSFFGPPPTRGHTADHKDRNPNNDTVENLRWLCTKGQVKNRIMPETQNDAFIIVKDEIEKTAKDWVDYLKGQNNSLGREYTANMVGHYARNRQNGFSYKEYPDLPGEVWKEITCSKTKKGRWEISNMNRVKYITLYAKNVTSGDRLSMSDGYPSIRINGKKWLCHMLSFMTFFPEEYATKRFDEMILHEDDNKLDFRPRKLRLGTRPENGTDAHNNGKYDGKKTTRMKCTSYIKGIFEKEHDSQDAAVKYLKYQGYTKASQGNISQALTASRDGKDLMKYDRTWKNST